MGLGVGKVWLCCALEVRLAEAEKFALGVSVKKASNRETEHAEALV